MVPIARATRESSAERQRRCRSNKKLKGENKALLLPPSKLKVHTQEDTTRKVIRKKALARARKEKYILKCKVTHATSNLDDLTKKLKWEGSLDVVVCDNGTFEQGKAFSSMPNIYREAGYRIGEVFLVYIYLFLDF